MNLLVNEAALEADIFNIFANFGFNLQRTLKRIPNLNLNKDIAAKVQVSHDAVNAHTGYILLICPHKTALKIGESFFQILPIDLDQATLKDCVSELLNMIGGNLQNKLPHANLELPCLIETKQQLCEIESITHRSDLIYEFIVGEQEDPIFQISLYSSSHH